jgi:hypothetical protein
MLFSWVVQWLMVRGVWHLGFCGLVDTIHAFLIGSAATMKKVAIGPRNNDKSHQFRPLLPFACARPELMRESVNHPTAY